MNEQLSNRTITVGGSVTGSALTAGDHNIATVTYTYTGPLPAPASVDPARELAALSEMLKQLRAIDAGKLSREVGYAAGTLEDHEPDKEAIAGALTRAAKVAQGATDFAERAEKLAPHVVALTSWLGVAGKAVAAAFGITL